MFKYTLAALFTLLIMSSAAFADGGCSSDRVPGSYISSLRVPDVFGNGTNVDHTWVFQLNLNSDGTAIQIFSGAPDYLIELGTESPYVGSWKCRSDGKLVVTLIRALFQPIPLGSPACDGVVCVSTADVELQFHFRTTYLFSVETNNTLKRLKSRTRRYTPTQDPSDPTAGTLGPIFTNQVVYKKLRASDADLLAP